MTDALSQTAKTPRFTPLKARLAVCIGSIFVGSLIYLYFSGDSGSLNLVCRHTLQAADLSVFVDGKLEFSDQISGTVKKRFGFLDKKVEGTFSRTLHLSLGDHVISVHLQSPEERFDQTRQIAVSLAPSKESTVVITAQKGDLSLAYRGIPLSSGKGSGPAYFSSFRSLLLTIVGSVMSAAIGFTVQEFLRSRKAALVAARNSKTV